MADNESVQIDVEKIIRDRAGDRHIPAFVIRWIKKFIHEDFLNDYFRKGTTGIEFASGSLEHLGVTVKVEGLENIPLDGRFTFAGNHPLGGIDALGVIAALGQKYDGQIAFLANDFLMNLKQIAEYLVPVNKMGRQSGQLAGQVKGIFDSDRQILIFPAGQCSRRYDGVIQDCAWKKTFISKSRESQRDIVPMWFSGQNSRRFYAIDRICRALRIKLNIPMFFLPDELYRGRGKTFRLVIGRPIPWQTFTQDKKDTEWAAWVRSKTYELATL